VIPEAEESKIKKEKVVDETRKTSQETLNTNSSVITRNKKNGFQRAWAWATEDKSRLASIIFLFSFIVLIIVLASLGLDMGAIMISIVNWFENKIGLVGLYIGVFVISIFGNFTVIFPVPYTIALVTITIRPSVSAFETVLFGVCAGAGAAIGEASAWFLGKATKQVLEENMKRQVLRAKNWIDKGLMPFIIFAFAATPLPDDAILVFIGLLAYPLWKTIIWCFLGKIALTTGMGLVAKYLAGNPYGRWIFWAFGLNPDGTVGAATPIWLSALTWIVSIVVIGVVLFLDWGAIWNKITRSFQKKKFVRLAQLDNSASIITIQNSVGSRITSQLTHETIPTQKVDIKNTMWQCSLEEIENNKDDFPNYLFEDFFSLSYLTKELDKEFIIDNNWFENFMNELTKKHTSIIDLYKWKTIQLPEILEAFNEKDKINEEKYDNLLFFEMKIKHQEINRLFKIGLIIEKQKENKLIIRCLSKNETRIISSIKRYSSHLLLQKLLSLLVYSQTNPDAIKKITFSYSSAFPNVNDFIEKK
jgi:membrane protein YqaA with SNARE-associated domain